MSEQIKTVILGASGYTGVELLRFLLVHPQVQIVALTGESQAGQPMGAVYPHLAHAGLPDLVKIEEVDFSGVDLVFCCLPHGTTQEIIAGLPESVKVVDLSADFRLFDVETYAQWYGHPHQAPTLQKQAVYGLSEHQREAIKAARLVANPGCYPTSTLLPLLPLLKVGLLQTDSLIVDAKSGVSGAGRAAKRQLNFCETSEGMAAYGVGNHRHIPEMEQELSAASGEAVQINFTPHLIPMRRGMLTTIYAKASNNNSLSNLCQVLHEVYAKEPFVHLLPEGEVPATHHVRGSNHCHINVFAGRRAGEVILVSAIDNLVKGASGQAVQNMNIMFGLPEVMGLEGGAVFP
jgi:N-acetyl-gamma-glutamyl-phosphate reductase